MNINRLTLLAFLPAIILSACQYTFGEGENESHTPFNEMAIQNDFNFETSREFELIFPEVMEKQQARLIQVSAQDSIDLGIFNLDGHSIVLKAEQGIDRILAQPINFRGNGDIIFDISGTTDNDNRDNNLSKAVQQYHPIGKWNSNGVPDYLLADRDQISENLLLNINATLPEGRPVPSFNPEYLNGKDMNTLLVDNADVWVTFVHEGAGYRNVLGYFTYQQGNKPSSIDEVDSLKIIFPNVSLQFSGGGLKTGDKVYLGRFTKGTVLSWFLMPNAWNSRSQSINNVEEIKYAINDFNDYTTADYRQHTLVLNNEEDQLLLLSFEDITRPGGDNDFNDAIFYVTANPYTAVETADLVPTKVATDSDGDGLYDHEDDYPNDPERAYQSYWPGKNSYATVLFEDKWPSIGDYDFNDLVVDYKFVFTKSASGGVKDLEIQTVTKAVGGLVKSSLMFNLGVKQNLVESVSGNRLDYDFIKTNPNGTESGVDDAVIPIFDNSRNILPPPAGYSVTNVVKGQPHVDEVYMNTKVIFNQPIAQNSLNYYDPFIITEFNRGQEIHLPGQNPTVKANTELFGTADDASNLNTGFTYKNSDGLPWALHVMRSIKYPRENVDFAQSYLNFRNWAESGGVTHTDWYFQNSSNMNTPMFYDRN
jgi:LruC domain-containing protein